MLCPHCSAELHTDPTFADYACECGLAGPRDVLEALAPRLTSDAILVLAEALLREREVHMVSLSRIEGVTLWGADDRKIRSRGSLAHALARLEKERT